MKKWLIKQEWSKTEEEQCVVRSEAPHDEKENGHTIGRGDCQKDDPSKANGPKYDAKEEGSEIDDVDVTDCPIDDVHRSNCPNRDAKGRECQKREANVGDRQKHDANGRDCHNNDVHEPDCQNHDARNEIKEGIYQKYDIHHGKGAPTGRGGRLDIHKVSSQRDEVTVIKEAPHDHHHHHHHDDNKHFLRLFLPKIKPSAAPQVWAGVTVAATHLGVGCALGLSTSSLPPLNTTTTTTSTLEGDTLRLTTFQVALFSSVVLLGAAVGSLVSGVVQVWLGQRVSLLMALPLALASWVIMIATNNAWVVVAGRTLQGFTLGFMVGPARNYVVELAHTTLRGTLLASLGLMEQLGWLIMYAAGAWSLPWRWVSLGCGCLSTVIPFAGLLFLPDSPRWLAEQDRPPEALKSLMFFRGPHYDSHEELSAMFNNVKKKINARDQLRAMEDPKVLNLILLLTFLILASTFNGNIVLCTNIIPIFKLLDIDFSAPQSAVILGAVSVIGSLFNLLIIERVGRKPLLVASFLLCFGAIAMLGSYIFDKGLSMEVTQNIWIPLVSLATFFFFSRPGISVLSLLREELLPTRVRSTAVALLYSLYFTGIFMASQTYKPMVDALGQYGVFWLYACFNFALAATVGLALAETRGRTLEEISNGCYPSKTTRAHSPENSSNHFYKDHRNSNGYQSSVRSIIEPRSNRSHKKSKSPRKTTYVHRKSTQPSQITYESTETQTDSAHYLSDGSEKIVILNLRNTYV